MTYEASYQNIYTLPVSFSHSYQVIGINLGNASVTRVMCARQNNLNSFAFGAFDVTNGVYISEPNSFAFIVVGS